MDLARKDMERVGARERDEIDRMKWRILSRCGDPEQGEAERRRRSLIAVLAPLLQEMSAELKLHATEVYA